MTLRRTLMLWALGWLCAAAYAQGDERDAPGAVIANGVFLVAQPSLTEPTFRRTVILLTQPPGSGPMGIIINRPTDQTLADVLPQHPALAAQTQPLYFGGPVARQGLVFLVRTQVAPPRSLRVLDDVYLMTDAAWVEQALAAGLPAGVPKIEVRVYAGYSGWVPGQLQNELKRDGWYIVPAGSAAIFEGDLNKLWAELARRAVLKATSFKIQQNQ